MVSVDVAVERKSAWSAWWSVKLTFGAASFAVKGRVSRSGVDLQDRCYGIVFRAVDELADSAGIKAETICVEGWAQLMEAAKELALLAE